MRVHHPTSRGFTILELIVALGVTVLMLFMINALFTTTSDGVSVGMALSDVIGAGRAVADQIDTDARQMTGPHALAKGVMVIVCQKQTGGGKGVPYMERRVQKLRGEARTDQVMWIRLRGKSSNQFGAMPITPANANTYSSATKTEMGTVDVIRVWYGHGLRTDATGGSASQLAAVGANRVSNNWPLCRHALFLSNRTLPTAAVAVNRAEGAWYGASVVGISAPGVPLSLFAGLTDVADYGYENPSHPIGTFVAPSQAAVLGSQANRTLAATGITPEEYNTRALNNMFLTQRMFVNPVPQLNMADPYTSAQIAQMHPLLMENVSDFIVEFAADVEDNLKADGTPGTDNLPDDTPDVDLTGEVKWYGLAPNPDSNSWAYPVAAGARLPWGAISPKAANALPNGDGGVAFVFRHDTPDHWPYMVRIRYRICDQRGDLLGDASPELLDKDSVSGAKVNVGKWFEQIIKVDR